MRFGWLVVVCCCYYWFTLVGEEFILAKGLMVMDCLESYLLVVYWRRMVTNGLIRMITNGLIRKVIIK